MRTLITGASGFAGRYLAQSCHRAGEKVLGVSRSGDIPERCGEALALDLLDADAVRRTLRAFRPQVVYHLAALSSVGRSWEDPATTMHENVTSSVNLLEGLRLEAPRARVIWVSSCEVYGAPEELPISEDATINPANPYAVSKAAGDMLASLYVDAHGLDLIRARPFSHAGPGQRSIFILSSVARQVAEARLRGENKVQIYTGNPNTRRDFTDVRDIVRAYRLLAERARPGVYNVSSGQSVSAAEQVSLAASVVAPMAVEHVVDPERVRAHEVMDLRGSHERISAVTAWEPQIPLRQTMADTIDWWEQELSRTAPADAVRH